MSKQITPYHKSLYAIIDLGSNSFHMLVCRLVADSVQIVDKVKRKVRLASGLDANLMLDEAAFARGFECLSFFAERLQDIPKQNIRIVATATLRLAKNRADFIAQAEQILGYPVELLSGEQEAQNIYLGVAHTSSEGNKRLVLDIGGASTELILGSGFDSTQVVSLDMGCVTFNKQFFQQGYSQEFFAQAQARATDILAPVIGRYQQEGWDTVLGGSGTFQAIFEVLAASGEVARIDLPALTKIKQQVIACGSVEHLDLDGLVTERKPVFASGLAILITLFEQLGIEQLQLSSGALREGLLYELLPERRLQKIRERTVEAMMQRYCVDQSHAQRVENIATFCFNQLAVLTHFQDDIALTMLKVASSLHEIGLIVEYKKNRSHAVYLLRHADLPGISQAERQLLVALVGNYKDDINLALLNEQSMLPDDILVRLLAIFRLAIVLAKRRKDSVLPEFQLQLEDNILNLSLDAGWCQRHPLIMAELAQEQTMITALGLSLQLP